ncbi:MAG: hypothetical protein UHU21_12280 [Lachnospiraceae bacterium]|jgi:hypothetical protein|nr:hypothetical protein [Lachnospiraceae bacterium]
METITETKKSRPFLLWLLIILAPIIAGWLIGLLSGTSPMKLDAWNTTWNDEVGYYRVVRILRYYGVPRGMTGFNEITSGNVPYGPYNVFTYIPYYLISLVTGCDSHNYIYFCNIIMAVLANIVFVALVRPGRMQSLLTALFFLTQLIAARYTWSGMAEASYHFYIVVFMGLVIWYLKSPDASRLSKDLALLAMVLLTFAFGVMRPYFAVMFLIPLYLVVFRNNKIGEFSRFISTLLILAAMFGTVVLMYYFMGFIAEYFEVAPALKLAQIIRSGQAGQIFQSLLQVNKESVRSAIDMIKEYRWAGGIAFLFYFEWAILFVEYIAALVKRKKDGSAAVMFLLLVSGIMIYEATILLYKSYQLHRMLLAITIAYSLFLIAFGTILPWVNAAAVIACVCFYIVMKPAAFALPQINADSITDEQLQEYKETLIKNLPMQQVPAIGMFDAPDSLDPYWENTVAKITEDNNVQLSFVLPDYLSLNFCSEKYMSQCIKNDGFSSRYILVKTDSDLNEMCRTRYKNIWEGIGHSIYDRTKKTEDQGGI